MIARFVRGDIDGALTLLQVAEQSATPREAALLAALRAELLQLAGRQSEANALARAAYDAIREETNVEQPRADIGAALWYAQAAQIAAQAGEQAAAERWRDKAMASPAPSLEDKYAVAWALSAAARGLGDQEAAWQLVSPFVGSGFGGCRMRRCGCSSRATTSCLVSQRRTAPIWRSLPGRSAEALHRVAAPRFDG